MIKPINQPFDSWKKVTLKDVRIVGMIRRSKGKLDNNLVIKSIKHDTIAFHTELFNNEEGD